MVAVPVLLTVIGLGLDVVGAAIIALPDIPRVRLVLWSARVRNGLREMESTGISQAQVGYRELETMLEGIYKIEFPEDVFALRVGQSIGSRYGFESVFLFTNPSDENEQTALGQELGEEVDYRVARGRIQERIDTEQALVRGIGFLLLSSGFILQIIGYLM